MKKNLWIMLLVGVLIFFTAFNSLASEKPGTQSDNPRFNMGISLDFYYYMLDIPEKLQTVPAHPDDSPTGSTTTNLNSALIFALKLNLRADFMGTENFSIFGGADFGLGMGFGLYRQGIYDTQLCDYGGESYAFTQLVPYYFSVAPVIGLRYYQLIIEVSFPYTSYELRNGHDRWGRWDEVKSYTWEGFGQRYYLGLDFSTFHSGIFYETYQMDFFGNQVSTNIIGLSLAYYLW